MKRSLKSAWMARCMEKKCRSVRRLEAGTLVDMWQQKPSVRCACGAFMAAKRLVGHTTGEPCGDKCLSAKGAHCECACGGKNHGRNHA